MRKLLLVLCISFFSINTMAQDDVTEIAYGNVVQKTMEKSQTEVEFSFEGIAGDIVVITATIDDNDIINGLSPELELLNARGTRLAKTSYIYNGADNREAFRSRLVMEIPADGLYSILVTNAEMFSLQNDAPFTLRLIKPEILKSGTPILGQVSSSVAAYFVVILEDPFSISYSLETGGFKPAINIGRIQDGGIEMLAAMHGQNLLKGSLSVEPNRNTLHLITVGRSPYDLDGLFSTSDAEFTIQMTTEQ